MNPRALGAIDHTHLQIQELRVQELREIRWADRARLLDSIAGIYHACWKGCTEEYHSERAVRRLLKRRLDTVCEPTFVALTPSDELVGTAAIGTDDFYGGFCRSNGIDACWVGRDLYTAPGYRGIVLNGLKVWQHLLQARLRWLGARQQATMTVFTEPGPADLPALYARSGAAVARHGLHHRRLGLGTVTMLQYPVDETLAMLESVQRRSTSTMQPSSPAAVHSGIHSWPPTFKMA
jgi:hypothetical protein